MPADEHSRWPDQAGGIAMRSARGPYGRQMRQQHRRLIAELLGVPTARNGRMLAGMDLDAWLARSLGDACDRTHLRVYADTVRAADRARAVVHVIARMVVAPPFTGMRTAYVTRCGRALPVGESVRCARPVTCTDPRCAAADTRKPGGEACNLKAGRS